MSTRPKVGASESAVQTIGEFYSSTKQQPSDRVFQSLANQLITSGEYEQAKTIIAKISDEVTRNDLESVLDATMPADEPIAMRTWTSKGGNFGIEAKFVSANDKTVTLEKANGTTISVELSKLSEVDQE